MLKSSTLFVGDLQKHIGTHRKVHIDVPGESFRTALAQVVGEISGELMLESVSHGIVVHGTLQVEYCAQCSYGLVDIVKALDITVNELFEENKNIDFAADDSETYHFSGSQLEIEQLLRDYVITALPLVPVCSHGPSNCEICLSQIAPNLGRSDLPNGTN